MMTTPPLNLIFMQGFNLDLELPSCNDCLIILCEMIIQACVPTAGGKKSSERKMRIEEDFFFSIYWPRVQIQILTISMKDEKNR